MTLAEGKDGVAKDIRSKDRDVECGGEEDGLWMINGADAESTWMVRPMLLLDSECLDPR